ncbi:glycosyltransferase [Patescibacteria group bacterium]|nr:MAG: glycosyltransferase [Patescibacteria group bacterium]
MLKVLLTVPVRNEEVVLEKNIRTLFSFCEKNLADYDWQIQIVDNGSTDRTAPIAQAFARGSEKISFLHLPESGRGKALSSAWTAALGSYDILAYMDADLSADLSVLPVFLWAIRKGAGVAYGSRFESSSSVTRSLLREVSSRVYRFLARRILGIRARDLQCGFKAVSSSAWSVLRERVNHPGWFWDTELLFWAERLKMKVVAVPVDWVEARDQRRKSTVRLFRTALGYLRDIVRLKLKLLRKL